MLFLIWVFRHFMKPCLHFLLQWTQTLFKLAHWVIMKFFLTSLAFSHFMIIWYYFLVTNSSSTEKNTLIHQSFLIFNFNFHDAIDLSHNFNIDVITRVRTIEQTDILTKSRLSSRIWGPTLCQFPEHGICFLSTTSH